MAQAARQQRQPARRAGGQAAKAARQPGGQAARQLLYYIILYYITLHYIIYIYIYIHILLNEHIIQAAGLGDVLTALPVALVGGKMLEGLPGRPHDISLRESGAAHRMCRGQA